MKTQDEGFDLGDELERMDDETPSGNGRKKAKAEHHFIPCASFPGLIDLVLHDGGPAFLLKDGDDIRITKAIPIDKETTRIPPKQEAIPFPLSDGQTVLDLIGKDDPDLYGDVLKVVRTTSILPSEAHAHLCSVYVFFTYLWEAFEYYLYLWLFGLPERGKSRLLKILCALSYRGLYTETINEANLFRFADLFRGTLALDLYEVTEKASRKGCQDLLLGRFEKGVRVARVIDPRKGAFRDTVYYRVDGPTLLATNKSIPEHDPLFSRCLQITMPEARGIYPNGDKRILENLRVRLLAFRTKCMDEPMPDVPKPIAGRLGDLLQPLLSVSKILPDGPFDALMSLITRLDDERHEADRETLAGRIAQSLWDLREEIKGGRLSVSRITANLNEDQPERQQITTKRVGNELSAMSIQRTKKHGNKEAILPEETLDALWRRFRPEGFEASDPVSNDADENDLEDLPKVPKLPQKDNGGGETGEMGEKPENDLPRGNPNKTRPGETGENGELFQDQFCEDRL